MENRDQASTFLEQKRVFHNKCYSVNSRRRKENRFYKVIDESEGGLSSPFEHRRARFSRSLGPRTARARTV